MELAQEVVNSGVEWPENAMSVMRDFDGEIKFSSKTKGAIVKTPRGIFMRGDDCLINNRMVSEPPSIQGTKGCPEIITRDQYETFYQLSK